MDREWMAARRTDTEADLGHVKGKGAVPHRNYDGSDASSFLVK